MIFEIFFTHDILICLPKSSHILNNACTLLTNTKALVLLNGLQLTTMHYYFTAVKLAR